MSLFGAAKNTGFGGNTTFGGTTGGGFGTSNMFGQQTPASTGLFGNTGTTTTPSSGIFGAAAPAAFGQTAQNTSFGGFGTNTQAGATGGLFGGSTGQQNTSLFSTPTTAANAFGAKTPAPGAFGATSQAGGGLFGSTPAAGTSLFGGTSTSTATPGGLFGATNTAGFGGQQQLQAAAGTVVKFNPPNGQDTMMKGGVTTTISTRHQCITAMKEYEAKSLEELRVEDYTANRKGPQAGSTGLFGPTQTTQASTGFSFGQTQNKPTGFAFGQQQQPSTASTAAGGLFGQTQTQSGGLFGTSTTKSLFGTTTTTSTATPAFGGFGNTGTTSLFGQQPAQNKTLFPTSTPGSTLFGASTQQTSTAGGFGGFGTTGGFGTNTQNQAAGGLFGQAKPAFGQPTSSTGLTFGQNNALGSGGLFGNKPAGQVSTGFSFGQTQPQGFGTTSQAGSLFANKPAGFGAQTNTLGGATGFGTAGTSLGGLGGGSLFGANQNKPNFSGIGTGFGTSTGGFGALGGTNLGQASYTAANPLLGQQTAGGNVNQDAQLQQQLLALTNSPYGDSPLFRNLKEEQGRKEEMLKPTNPVAQKAVLAAGSQYKVSPRPTAKIKPKPLHNLANGKSQLFDGLEDEDSSFGNDTFVPRRSVKKLVIKNNDSMSNVSFKDTSRLSGTGPDDSQVAPPTPESTNQNGVHDRLSDHIPSRSNDDDHDVVRNANLPKDRPDRPLATGLFKNVNESFLNDTISDFNPRSRLGGPLDVSRTDSTGENDNHSQRSATPPPPHPAGIVLRRHGYYTLPTLEELAEMVDENGDCWVEDFLVGRDGFGNVMFPALTNIANMNLDDIVHFRRKEITIYPEDDRKPQEGVGLNKKAQVTLDCVWPSDKTSRDYIKDPERLVELQYQEKLERATAKIGAKFLDYRPETGSWVFEVKHFSKYGLPDDSDDEDGAVDAEKLALLKQQQQKQLAIQKQQIKLIPGQKPPQGQGQEVMEGQGQWTEKEAQWNNKQTERSGMMELEMTHPCPLGSDDDGDDLMDEPYPKEMGEIDDMKAEEVPSSHRLANRLGVLAEELQLRKASFFGDDEEDIVPTWKAGISHPLGVGQPSLASEAPFVSDLPDEGEYNWSAGKSLLSTSFSKPTVPAARPVSSVKRIQSFQPVTPFSMSFAVPSKQVQKPSEHILLPTSTAHQPKARHIVGSRIKRKVPALADSLFAQKQDLIMDAGLMMAQKFRTGWGNNWELVHTGKPIMETEDKKDPQPPRFILVQHRGDAERSRLATDAQRMLLERMVVSPLEHNKEHLPKLTKVLEEHLQLQLEHTELSVESGCPQAVPSPGNAIIKSLVDCAEAAIKTLGGTDDKYLYKQAALVWQLCEALWGDLDNLVVEDARPDSYAYNLARQEAFSEWLKQAVNPTVHQQVEVVKSKAGCEADAIFQHLSGHQLEEACQAAQQQGDHRVALLISQASGSDMSRNLIKKQLGMWEQSQMDEHIEEDRLRIYVLLSGDLVWTTSLGDQVNVCQDLDWKRALAMHLWYHCPPTASISEAVASYITSYEGTHTAAPPLPGYLETVARKLSETEDKQDVCYHLLRLYCDKSHPLHCLLCPTTATANFLDFRLSWQLGQLLQALEFTHLSDYHAGMLSTSFASQLETLGLWHWAAFVLIHITDHTHREYAVKELLQRYISLHPDEEDEERETFLKSSLGVPVEWIHQAKAIKACHSELKDEEAWHWLKARHYNKAHQLILKHLASHAIVNENFSSLKSLLSELGSPDVCRHIEDWDKGGRVFLDYITMMETLEQLQQSEPSSYELEKLQSEVSQLSKRITGLRCYTATDRLCQSEMAKRAGNLMRTLLQMKCDREDINEMLVTETTDLPLPEDYALQELHQLTKTYMLGVAMS